MTRKAVIKWPLRTGPGPFHQSLSWQAHLPQTWGCRRTASTWGRSAPKQYQLFWGPFLLEQPQTGPSAVQMARGVVLECSWQQKLLVAVRMAASSWELIQGWSVKMLPIAPSQFTPFQAMAVLLLHRHTHLPPPGILLWFIGPERMGRADLESEGERKNWPKI